ncbi:MAG: hypothetical protein AB7I19_11100 [Planctomycetota bacterium]
MIDAPLARALVRKELGDQAVAFRHGALICAIAAVVLAAADASPGSPALAVGFACIVWLAAHVSSVFGDGEDPPCGIFLARVPTSLAAIFTARIVVLLLLGSALLGIALLPQVVSTVLGGTHAVSVTHRFSVAFVAIPTALAWAGGTLAIAPMIPRSALAIAGGPIAMAPVFFWFASAGLPAREVMTWSAGGLLIAVAGLIAASFGFVRGRRLLAPRGRAAVAVALAAIPCYGAVLVVVNRRAHELTHPSPATWIVRAGQSVLDSTHAQIFVSSPGSDVAIPVKIHLASGEVRSAGKPRTLHPSYASSQHRLATRLRRGAGEDSLLRTSRGERYWSEGARIVIARNAGEPDRVEHGVDVPLAVRGDAVLLRIASWGHDEPERCRILDLTHGDYFPQPIVSPDRFFACDGTWLILDTDTERWIAQDPRTGERSEVRWLEADETPVHNLDAHHMLVRGAQQDHAVVDRRTRARTLRTQGELRPLESDAPSVLADGTSLFLLGEARDGQVLVGLAPDGSQRGSHLECASVLGGLGGDEVLVVLTDRRRIARHSVSRGHSPLNLRFVEGER